jgi:16S rRNA (cytosine1402-N4)-methyltransferase
MNVLNVIPMRMPSQPPPSVVHKPPHSSVLLEEVCGLLRPDRGGVFVDVTLGAGGHSFALLERGASTLVGIDRDPVALDLARARLATFGSRAEYHHAAFEELESLLADTYSDGVDGILADLGVSSMQLDNPDRGMSFRRAGPLDMRMNPHEGQTALELIESLDDDELTELIGKLGDERRARRVARCIRQALEAGELKTTLDLRRAVVRAVGPSRVGGVDPATRTFQALRIAVNTELQQLDSLLACAHRVLRPGGVLAIISFHSLEDRMVKRAFRDPRWERLQHKPIVAGAAELDLNPRARSAKLRGARRPEVV